jgi:hydrogenase maturation protease
LCKPAILVLGVGNLLLRDEGFGVHAIRRFAQSYEVTPNVRVIDGGTAGLSLLQAILEASHIIVADVARMGSEPGTVARLDGEDLSNAFKTKQSAHDWGLGEILLQAKMVGHFPSVTVLAIEPEDMSTFALDLSPRLQAALPSFVAKLADEVELAGGRVSASAFDMATMPGM